MACKPGSSCLIADCWAPVRASKERGGPSNEPLKYCRASIHGGGMNEI